MRDDSTGYSHAGSPPLVSAIMPARNAASTIRSAISSVQSQTMTDWELIIVDDGSTDSTYNLAQAAANSDSRIRAIRSPFLGRGGARNRCLTECRGAWVAVCDADDISFPDRFAQQLAAADDGRADVVVCSTSVALLPNSEPALAITSAGSPEAIADALKQQRMPIQFATALVRRTSLQEGGGFDTELHRNQDFGFFLRNYRNLRFAVVVAPLVLYRMTNIVATYSHLRENNFYRWLARRRANNASVTAATLRSSFGYAIFSTLVVPLQYAKHFMSRRMLGIGLRPLTTEERVRSQEVLSMNTVA